MAKQSSSITRMARQKFGRIFLKKPLRERRKNAEESFSRSLSILHNSYRNKDWVKKLKDAIRINYGGISLG